MPGAHNAPEAASPLTLTSSIYSPQLIAQNGINAGKSLNSQHLRATVQSNVYFGSKTTTYTVVHKYLHFIIVSANELASQPTQGWDSPPTEGTSRNLTSFLLSAWSLFLSLISPLKMCKGKITIFCFACVLSWSCVGKTAIPKKQLDCRGKATVLFKTEVVVSFRLLPCGILGSVYT